MGPIGAGSRPVCGPTRRRRGPRLPCDAGGRFVGDRLPRGSQPVLGGVSHELRTPLARMLALTDTVALPLDEDERDADHGPDPSRDRFDAPADRGDGAAGSARERRADRDRRARRRRPCGARVRRPSPGGGRCQRDDDHVPDHPRVWWRRCCRGCWMWYSTTWSPTPSPTPAPGTAVSVGARGLAGAVELSVQDTGGGHSPRARGARIRAVLPRRGSAIGAGYRPWPGDRQAHRRGVRRAGIDRVGAG